MNGLQYTYRFTGPPDQGILMKNRGNNAIINSKRSMPQKFSPSAGDSMFSRARHTYSEDAGGGTIGNTTDPIVVESSISDAATYTQTGSSSGSALVLQGMTVASS